MSWTDLVVILFLITAAVGLVCLLARKLGRLPKDPVGGPAHRKVPFVHEAALLFMLAGALVFAYQIYFRLLTGAWLEVSILTALLPLFSNSFQQWFLGPDSSAGLHKVVFWSLDFIPFSVLLAIIGLIILPVKPPKPIKDYGQRYGH